MVDTWPPPPPHAVSASDSADTPTNAKQLRPISSSFTLVRLPVAVPPDARSDGKEVASNARVVG
jgi:hypothetical protein